MEGNNKPVVYVRRIPGFDPRESGIYYRAEADRCDREAARRQAAVEEYLLDKEPADREAFRAGRLHYGSGGGEGDLHEWRQQEAEAARARHSAVEAEAAAPRPPMMEISVAQSYAVKDLLKARGYRFGQAGGRPAWVRQVPDTEAAAKPELEWLRAQSWPLTLIEQPGSLLDAVLEGRPELVPHMPGK